MSGPPVRLLVENRKARHDYELGDRFEAGIALLGPEVKSLRAGRANLREAWVRLADDGAWLMGCHISPYAEANRFNSDPVRPRRLLLHRHELDKLRRAVQQRGMTVVPTRLYLKGSRIKVEIALGRGRRSHDKRHAIKEREARREIARAGRGKGQL